MCVGVETQTSAAPSVLGGGTDGTGAGAVADPVKRCCATGEPGTTTAGALLTLEDALGVAGGVTRTDTTLGDSGGERSTLHPVVALVEPPIQGAVLLGALMDEPTTGGGHARALITDPSALDILNRTT